MAIRKVTPTESSGSVYIILTKDGLNDDEVLNEEGEVHEQYANIERTDEGVRGTASRRLNNR